MSAPTGHNRSGRLTQEDDDDEIDPVEEMIKKTGCLELHYETQFCMAEHQDWRKCQNEVKRFRECMNEYQLRKDKASQ